MTTLFKKLTAIAMIFFLSSSQLTYAGLEDEMENMFGAYVNVTNPQVFETQRRGGFSGGSVFVRSRVTNPQLVSFDPPSLKGGCNGIDMYLGSFSFINKEQFINYLRNIASNALGYAFELALQSLCGQCMDTIKNIRSIIDNANKSLLDSCTAARNLVQGKMPFNSTAITALKNTIAGTLAESGIASDNCAAGSTGCSSPNNPTVLANNAGTLENFETNVVYEALTKSDASSWFISNDDAIKEALMSVVGTIVIIKKTDGTEVDLKTNTYNSTLSLLDVITAEKGSKITILKCDTSKCLNPTPSEVTVQKSIRDKVKVALLGDSTNKGILELIHQKNGGQTLSDSQKAFIKAVPQPIYAQIRFLAIDKNVATSYATSMIDVITAELGIAFYRELFHATSTAMMKSQSEFTSTMMEKIISEETRLNEHNQQAKTSLDRLNGAYQTFAILRDSIQRSYPDVDSLGIKVR